MCYVGQSHHLEIPLSADATDPLAALYREFLAAHDRVYGYSNEAPARIVNLRTVHRSPVARPPADIAFRPTDGPTRKGDRRILTDDGPVTAAVYDRAALSAGTEIDGPAIVEQVDTTTLIEAGWHGTVAPNGTLLLTTQGMIWQLLLVILAKAHGRYFCGNCPCFCHSGAARRAEPGTQEHRLRLLSNRPCSWVPGSSLRSAPE